jgi:nitrogen permease regulator 2-like protein
MSTEVQLLGITYSEFDNKVGPQLKYSFPEDVLSTEAFEAYSDYVIVSKQLCEKLIVVEFEDVQFLNYSVAIDNTKYHRNALLFAFGFVLASGVNTEPYGAVLKKITTTFVNLEVRFNRSSSAFS